MTDATTENYTPTTEQIANAVLLGVLTAARDLGSELDQGEFRDQFDRWLAIERAEARRAGMKEAMEIARNVYATSQAAVLQRKRTVAGIIAAIGEPDHG